MLTAMWWPTKCDLVISTGKQIVTFEKPSGSFRLEGKGGTGFCGGI